MKKKKKKIRSGPGLNSFKGLKFFLEGSLHLSLAYRVLNYGAFLTLSVPDSPPPAAHQALVPIFFHFIRYSRPVPTSRSLHVLCPLLEALFFPILFIAAVPYEILSVMTSERTFLASKVFPHYFFTGSCTLYSTAWTTIAYLLPPCRLGDPERQGPWRFTHHCVSSPCTLSHACGQVFFEGINFSAWDKMLPWQTWTFSPLLLPAGL